MRLEKLVGWGQHARHEDESEDENIPEGWWTSDLYKDISDTRDITNTVESRKQTTLPEGWRQDQEIQPELNSDTEAGGTVDNVSSYEAKRIHNKSDKLSVQKGEKRKASPTKFQFKKKGKLNKKEIQQLQKTHTSMLTWLVGKQKNSPICKVQDMEWKNKNKEEN